MVDLKISEEDVRQLNESTTGETNSSTFSCRIHLKPDEKTAWEELGRAQVESLLAFTIDAETERKMEHAEIEARVEDRIIRRKNGFSD